MNLTIPTSFKSMPVTLAENSVEFMVLVDMMGKYGFKMEKFNLSKDEWPVFNIVSGPPAGSSTV